MIGVLKGIVEDTSPLFYVCAYPPSGDLSGAALEVPSEALLHLENTFATRYIHNQRIFHEVNFFLPERI